MVAIVAPREEALFLSPILTTRVKCRYQNEATRPDKDYSLSDCRSMLALRTLGLTEVLTNNHHFTQEGFTILFP